MQQPKQRNGGAQNIMIGAAWTALPACGDQRPEQLGGYVRLLPSLRRRSATAPEMATVNSRSTPWHHSPGSQQPADAKSRRPGWHKRPVPGRQLMPHSAELKGAQIYRQQKARQANTYSETCLYRVLYGCGRMPGAAPASLTLGLRGTTDYHDQHKPTQRAPGQ